MVRTLPFQGNNRVSITREAAMGLWYIGIILRCQRKETDSSSVNPAVVKKITKNLFVNRENLVYN